MVLLRCRVVNAHQLQQHAEAIVRPSITAGCFPPLCPLLNRQGLFEVRPRFRFAARGCEQITEASEHFGGSRVFVAQQFPVIS